MRLHLERAKLNRTMMTLSAICRWSSCSYRGVSGCGQHFPVSKGTTLLTLLRLKM